jgi:hypothetical protein
MPRRPGRFLASIQPRYYRFLDPAKPAAADMDLRDAIQKIRAQDHRVFFRDKGDYLKISRVLDRKEAYR